MNLPAIALLGLFVAWSVAVTVCPPALIELDSWTGDAYVTASGSSVASSFSVAPETGAVSISQWVQLLSSQPAATTVLLQIGTSVLVQSPNVTRFGDALTVSWDAKESLISVQLVVNATVGNAPVTYQFQDDGTVPLNSLQYRNVVVILDASQGLVTVMVNSVTTAQFVVPALATYGFQLDANYSFMSIGGDYYGYHVFEGALVDMSVLKGVMTKSQAQYLTQFRVPFAPVNGTCVVQPMAHDHYFPFLGLDFSSYAFLEDGFTFPGSTVVGPYTNYGYYPLYESTFSLSSQKFSFVNFTAPQPPSPDNLSCGLTQSVAITLPSGSLTYAVHLWLNASAVPPLGSTLNITTAAGLVVMNIVVEEVHNAAAPITFLYQGETLSLTMQSSFEFCVVGAGASERGPVVADPPVVFAGAGNYLVIYAGLNPTDMVALTTTNCSSIAAADLLPLKPFYSFHAVNYYTVDIAETVPSGAYSMCVFPNGVISAQGHNAAICNADHTDTFFCSFDVAALPTGSVPLTRNWVTNMMHLGASYTDYISYGMFEIDYFLSVGGEAKILPQPGDDFNGMVWTPMSRPDGLWGTPDGNASVAFGRPEWVQYMSLAIYSSSTQQVYLSIRASSAVKVFIDGKNVFQANLGYANNTDAESTVFHTTNSIKLSAGWHQCIFKLWRAPDTWSSLFAIRIDQAVGLSWNYYIPSNTSSSTNFTNVCVGVTDKSIPCVPGNSNISHSECVGMGCCFDPGVEGNNCFAAGDPLFYRTDAKCGLGYSSAMHNISLCNPASSTQSTCCSNWGWCGSGVQYCTCPTCTDFRYINTPRCNYITWGKGASCLGATAVTLQPLTAVACKLQCDNTAGCIGVTTGVLSQFGQMGNCKLLFSSKGCSATVVDRTVNTLYLRSCTNCGLTLNTTIGYACRPSTTTMTPFGWNSIDPNAFVAYDQCEFLCTQAVACAGIQYNSTSGTCVFLTSMCPNATISTPDITLSYFTCESDFVTPPTPLPAAPNTSTTVAIGCFPDPTATFLSQPSFPGFDNMNLYAGNYNPMGVNASIDACQKYCWNLGAPYFALSSGSVCTCGARLPEKLPTADASLCTSPCAGNSSQVCGGPAGASVFRTNYYQGPCPDGFVYFKQNCYKYFGSYGGPDQLAWRDARHACNDMGATLASIHSRAENQFVNSFSAVLNNSNTRIAWVGGYLYKYDNSYQWSDGSNWDFTYWRQGEPSNNGGVEECITTFTNYPTPFKGTFNDANCNNVYPYVCKISLTASNGYPTIYAAVTAGSLACALPSSLGSLTNANVAWYPFDTSLSTSRIVFPDLSQYSRTITFTSLGSVGSKLTAPTFVVGVVGNAVLLNGSYFKQNTGSWDVPRSQVTAALWVKPLSTSSSNQIIISKSSQANVSDPSVPEFEWALVLNGDALCFVVGPFRACIANPLSTTAWTHVAGMFDGTQITLHINGSFVSSYNIAINANSSYVFSHNNATSVVIGYRSAVPVDPSRLFLGYVDDLRIYDAAVTHMDLYYLFGCTPSGSPRNIVNLYAGDATTIVLGGSTFNRNQKLSLSTSGCASGTAATMTVPVITIPFVTTVGVLQVPGMSPPPGTQNGTNQTSYLYEVCNVNQQDNSVVFNDANFVLAVTAITSVNGFSTQVVVNNTNFPLLLQLQGVNFFSGQIIAAAADSGCNMIDAMYPITSISASRTTAYLTINKPALITDVIHLCWGASSATLGQTTGSSGSNLVDIGIQVLMLDPNGFQYKRLALIDGSSQISPTVIRNGMYQSYSNYFLACADAAYMEDNYVLVVNMGLYVDYLIPMEGVSVCQLLTGGSFSSTHYYTSESPLKGNQDYDGNAFLVPPTEEWGRLGGSPFGFPDDGRDYLSFWGANYVSEFKGGCCQSSPKQSEEWFQAYSVIVWAVPNTTRYLRAVMIPEAVVIGAAMVLEAAVVDNHMEIVDEPVTFTLEIANHQIFVIDSSNGRLRWNTTLHGNLTVGHTATFNLTAWTTMPISNGNSIVFNSTIVDPLPPTVTPVNVTTNIETFLHFGPLNVSLPFPYFFVGMHADWFTLEGGEANLRPTAGDANTANFGDSYLFDTVNYTYAWQPVSLADGRFYNTTNEDSVSFFAGALFSPMDQQIRVVYSCDDGAIIYIDGVVVASDFQPMNQTEAEVVFVEAGWHQVFVKTANEYTLSLFELRIVGNGLGWALSIPAEIPENSELIVPGIPLLELLALGPQPFVGPFGEPYINESAARPRPGDTVASGQQWNAMESDADYFSCVGTNITSVSGVAVCYFALGLYSDVLATVEFAINVTDSLAVWFDGDSVLWAQSLTPGAVYATAVLTAGWHQVIIKLGALSGTVASFSVTPLSVTSPVAWSLSAPFNLPIGVEPLEDNQPLTAMLSLMTTTKLPPNTLVVGSSGDTLREVGVIPFSRLDNTSSIAYTDFDVNTQPRAGAQQFISRFPQQPFDWTGVESDSQGLWGREAMGGQFNQYWSVVLYAATSMSAALASISHSAGFALWIDGALVASAESYGNQPSTASIALSQGYHQILLKMRAPTDVILVPASNATTWNAAALNCHRQRFAQLCSLEAFCPYGTPRPGDLPVGNFSFYMPVRDDTNEWVQVGQGGTCSVTHPSWGQDPTPNSLRGRIACCGATVPPQVSISFASDPSTPGALGWAYSMPAIHVEPPVITVNSPRARVQTVTMNSTTPGARIYFTTDYSTPTANSAMYTGPFQVNKTTFFMAIAYVSDISYSYVAYYSVFISTEPTVTRTQCIAGAHCYIPIAGVDPNQQVTLVRDDSPNYMLFVNLSFAMSQEASLNNYSGIIYVTSDFAIVAPEMSAGEYYAFAYDSMGYGAFFTTITFSSLSVQPQEIVGLPNALLDISGGIQRGDGVLLLDVLYHESVTCDAGSCARGFTKFPSSVITVTQSLGNFIAQVNLQGFSGVLSCMCVCATGALNTQPWIGDIAPIPEFAFIESVASAVPITVNVIPSSNNTEQILSVFPPVVSDEQSLVITGNFSVRANATQYQVVLTPGTGQASNVSAPQCAVTSANVSTIVCVMFVHEGTSGSWNLAVLHYGKPIASASSFFVVAIPKEPLITGAVGSCVAHSDQCVSGSVIVFYGGNFDDDTPSNNVVVIGNKYSGATCPIINVTKSYIACALVVAAGTNGSFEVNVEINVAPSVKIASQCSQTLTFGAGDSPGWSGAGAPNVPPSPPTTTPAPTTILGAGGDGRKTALLVGSILGSLVGVLLVSFIVIRVRYSLIPKHVQQSKEMDYIEEQLMAQVEAEQRGSVSPRGARGVEVEPIRESDQSRYTAPAGSINNM